MWANDEQPQKRTPLLWRLADLPDHLPAHVLKCRASSWQPSGCLLRVSELENLLSVLPPNHPLQACQVPVDLSPRQMRHKQHHLPFGFFRGFRISLFFSVFFRPSSRQPNSTPPNPTRPIVVVLPQMLPCKLLGSQGFRSINLLIALRSGWVWRSHFGSRSSRLLLFTRRGQVLCFVFPRDDDASCFAGHGNLQMNR